MVELSLSSIWPLLLIGLAAGTFGSFLGVGGGLIVVPALLLLNKDLTPLEVTTISVATIAFTSFSSSVAYVRQGRVSLSLALPLALASLPGAAIGAFSVRLISRQTFDVLFAIVLVVLVGLLLVRRRLVRADARERLRIHKDAAGTLHDYDPRYLPLLGVIAFFGGVIATLFGIGGGVILVPCVIVFLRASPHLAIASMQLVILATALVGTLTHLLSGDMANVFPYVAAVGSGCLLGGQLGAHGSKKVRGAALVYILVVVMLILSAKLAFGASGLSAMIAP